jgi:hypothetical protein
MSLTKFEWTKLIGTNEEEFGYGAITGADGSIYITGTTPGDLDGQTNNGEYGDAFLIKYNSDGTKVWTKLIGTSKSDAGHVLTTDADGYIYITGMTSGDLDGHTNSGSHDAFLSKYNSDGTRVWTKLLGTSETEYVWGATSSADGFIYITGSTLGDLDGQTNNGDKDAFLTKFSADGTKIWTRLFGTNQWDVGTALTTSADGSIYLGGWSDGDLDGQTNNGRKDAFLSKYNSNGTKVWTKLIGTNGSDAGESLTTGADGSIYFAGWTSGDLDEENNNVNKDNTSSDIDVRNWDAFLTKYSSDGSRVWTRLLGTEEADSGTALTTGADGSIYFAGYTKGDLGGHKSNGSYNPFVSQYNEDGTNAWTRVLETNGNGYGTTLTTGIDGSIYISGHTYGDIGGQTNSGSRDVFLSKIVKNITSIISGTSANDILQVTTTDDSIDGGEGIDTVLFTGNFSNYSFTRSTISIQITDQRTGTNDGTDTLSNIEFIQFTDQLVEESKVDVVKTYSGEFSDYKFYNKSNGVYQIKTDSGYDEITGYPLLTFTGEATTSSFRDVSAIVDIKGTFDQVTGLNTDDGKMFRLYNASFKRLPDPDGLKYWIDKYTSGENDERTVASSFLVSDEFKERYGANVSDTTYVNNLYQNVLGRLPDSSGLNYWLGQLNSGAETRYEVLLGFSESAENKVLFTEMTGFG